MKPEEIERFEDQKYLLARIRFLGKTYVFLKDKWQNTEFLGLDSKGVNLSNYWDKYRENTSYCLPCELMLEFEEKVIKSLEHGILEMGVEKRILNSIENIYK